MSAVTQEHFKVMNMVGLKVIIRKIGDIIRISEESIFTKTQDALNIKALFERCVPKFLTSDQNQKRVVASERWGQ